MKYRKEIDGLRALAVLPVIFFHAGFNLFSGGFVGVDIFFVISGYLITSIIVAEKEAGTFNLINFYERRVRRIFPALFIVLLSCLPFVYFWFTPNDIRDFAKSLIAVSFFISNILFSQTSGYFDIENNLRPLLHTWSLSIEEQYYLFFPLLLMLMWKLGKKWILIILSILAIISLFLADTLVKTDHLSTFYLLPTRAWELLIGALLAIYVSKYNPSPKKIINEVGGLAGFIFICYSIFIFSEETPFPSLYALVPTVGAALIILYANQETIIGKLLSLKFFVGVGVISYSAYLWHQPIFAFARHKTLGEDNISFTLGLIITSIIIAYISWKYVEIPFRAKDRFTRKKIFKYGVIGILGFVFIGTIGVIDAEGLVATTKEERKILDFSNYKSKEVYREGACFLKFKQTAKDFSNICEATDNIDSTLIWGDSHAAALSFGFMQKIKKLSQYTTSGCPPIMGIKMKFNQNCKEINDDVLIKIMKQKPKHIYLHANWLEYKKQINIEDFNKTINYLKDNLPKSDITVIGAVPQWKPSLPIIMYTNHIKLIDGQYIYNKKFINFLNMDELINKIAIENKINFISALNILCKQSKCLVSTNYEDDVTLTTWDYGHLTAGGSMYLAEKILNN